MADSVASTLPELSEVFKAFPRSLNALVDAFTCTTTDVVALTHARNVSQAWLMIVMDLFWDARPSGSCEVV